MSLDHREKVVEVVRDSSGKATDAGQLLGLAQHALDFLARSYLAIEVDLGGYERSNQTDNRLK